MTKRQDLCLQRRSRPEQSDQRQPDQAANILHQSRASPNSNPLASRIKLPTMTGSGPDAQRPSYVGRSSANTRGAPDESENEIALKSNRLAHGDWTGEPIPSRRLQLAIKRVC